MSDRRPLRLAFSNPALHNTTQPIDTLRKRCPKRSLPIRTLTSKDLILTQQRLEYLNHLLPAEAAIVAGLVDNLLAQYYLEHQDAFTADEPLSVVEQDTVGTEYRAGHT
jgi:hypothetical protein